jgi:acetyltransferase-like isoleucine patch superfamily enzyme
MRKELAAYSRAHHGLQPRYIAYRVVRAIASAARRLVPRPTLGSHSWHLVQHRLSLRSSLHVDLEARRTFYEATMPNCGERLCVFPGSIFQYPQNVTIGNDVFINRNVSITAPSAITIGNAVLIGPGTVINSGNHRYEDAQARIRDQGHHLLPITIGDDVWIGANVTVLPGVVIGRGAVIGAGAVVSRDIPENAVAVGVPATVIGVRGEGRRGFSPDAF